MRSEPPTQPSPFLPPALKGTVLAALHQRYGTRLHPDESFELDGSADREAWTLTVTLRSADRSLFLPVEAALVVSENPKMTGDEARDALLDFAGYFFDQYFAEGRDATLPIDWAKFDFDDLTIRARGWERNQKLEDAADRLLRGEPIDDLL